MKIWLQVKRVFVCIDAIDELEPVVQRQLLNVLKDLITNADTRLFITGRSDTESGVQKHFEVGQRCTLNISTNQQDIREFVREKIKEDHNLNPEAMDMVLAKGIEDAIIEKSLGI